MRSGRAMASMLQSMESAVGWRQHRILPDLEESPIPERFRTRGSLDPRRSLRRRRPLQDVEMNFGENSISEPLEAKEKPANLRRLKQTAKNVFGTVSQKIQDSCQGPARTLVTSLAKIPPGGVRGPPKTRMTAPRTPRRKSGRLTTVSTPSSGGRMVSPSGEGSPFWPQKGRLSLRRSVRAAALRSPYGSPLSAGQKKHYSCDFQRVSSGIRQLKRLSQAFNNIIVQEERDQAILNYYHAMAQNMRNAQRRSRGFSRLNLRRRSAWLRWTRTSQAIDSFQQH